MLLPNSYGRGQWKTMLKVRKIDGELPDLVQNFPKRKVPFPRTELIDYSLAEKVFLNCLNCFRATEAKMCSLPCSIRTVICIAIDKRKVQITI